MAGGSSGRRERVTGPSALRQRRSALSWSLSASTDPYASSDNHDHAPSFQLTLVLRQELAQYHELFVNRQLREANDAAMRLPSHEDQLAEILVLSNQDSPIRQGECE